MKTNGIIVFAILFGMLLQGCSSVNTPPSLTEQEKRLNENYDDIVVVLDYMFASEYHWISINGERVTVRADFEDITIEDEHVAAAVARLLKHYHSIFKSGNIVEFFQWRGLRDIGSGVVYALDGNYSGIYEIGYITEIIPMSKDNWFYYVDDYEKWRAENH